MSEKQHFILGFANAADLSADRLDELAFALSDELRSLPRVNIDRSAGPAPKPGEKTSGSLGTDLIVAIASGAITSALPPLIGAVRDWLGRQPVTTGTISISCNGVVTVIDPGAPVDDVVKIMTGASKGEAD